MTLPMPITCRFYARRHCTIMHIYTFIRLHLRPETNVASKIVLHRLNRKRFYRYSPDTVYKSGSFHMFVKTTKKVQLDSVNFQTWYISEIPACECSYGYFRNKKTSFCNWQRFVWTFVQLSEKYMFKPYSYIC